MPKINVIQPLKDFDGEDILHHKRSVAGVMLCPACTLKMQDAARPLDLRLACTFALTTPTSRHNQTLADDEKFAQGELASKIYNNDNPFLKSEEIVILQKAIRSAYGPLEVFMILPLIESDSEPESE